jgi:crotonobetainyl-CoA:carnitine CoA-transferase CaiB-like acyl-CoA transferase
VLDLTDQCGHLAGRLLAELGADVVRVEPPGGHYTRAFPPFARNADGSVDSVYYRHYNAGKRSLTLALHSPEGKGLLVRLLGPARLVLVDRSAWTALRSELEAARDHLAVIGLTAYGLEAPGSDGEDSLHVAARAGFANLLGYDTAADPGPVIGDAEQPFNVAALYGVMAAFLALRSLRQGRRGAVMDVSAQAAAFQATEQAFAYWEYRGQLQRRRAGGYAAVNPTARWQYPSADGRLAYAYGIIPRAQPEWEALRAWMAAEGALEDLDQLQYARLSDLRDQHTLSRPSPAGEHAIEVVARFVMSLGAERVYREGQRRGLTWGRVFRPEETLAEEQFHVRGFFQPRRDGDGAAPYLYHSLPWLVEPTCAQRSAALPPGLARPGEHTAAVLAAWLGGDP